MSRSSVASKPWSAGSKLFLAFERRAVPIMRRLGELPFIVALRDGLPWSFIGLAVAFAGILVAQLASGGGRGEPLGLRVAGALLPAFGVMAAALVVILPVRLARATGYAMPALVLGSVASFALALPRPFGPSVIEYLRVTGTAGLFIAMLSCGIGAAWIWLFRRRVRPAVADWLGAAAGIATFGLLYAFRISLSAEIAAAMQPIAHLGDTYVALLAIVLIETLLWTAGVHGPAVLAAIVTPVYLTMQMQNTHAYTVHHPLPYVVVVSLFLFVFPGGAGATLPLAALFAVSRVPRLRRVGRATLVPALFNLNEPLLFAAPVVFNPHLVLPFVGAPVVLATITYAAVATGLVSRAAFYIPSSIPTFVSTYLATQDLRAIALAALNIAIATAMYFPFVRAYERHVEGEP
ncbi:MAG TPA: PTS transporter subunit EIIC [Candidatus Cybelea sp.]|jgi:PTS system cellobiose-specific IIC component|nr:PTS transporter subunit EIIC [Candidatus Cybelea sp.]